MRRVQSAECRVQNGGRREPGGSLYSALCILHSTVLDLLTALVDKSLVLCEASEAAARYRLLETVRQYARDRLRAGHPPEGGSREEERWRSRHLDYFLALAEAVEPHLWGPEQ